MELLVENRTEKSLLQELKKGITDMEQRRTVPHEETMQILRERLSSYGI